jgi:hypothetical protein
MTTVITFFPSVVEGKKKTKSLKFIACVNNTSNKFFGSVNDTGD